MELKKNVSQKPLRNFFVLFPHFWLSGMDMTPVAKATACRVDRVPICLDPWMMAEPINMGS